MPKRKLLDDYADLGYSEEEWLSFSRSKRWNLRHPERMKQYVKAWNARNKAYVATRARGYQLSNKYGLIDADYVTLLKKQNGRCGICFTDKPTGKWKVFAVDHCHETGEVRGLLCNECNRGMGLLRDSAELLRDAANYLDRHKIKTAQERAASTNNKDKLNDTAPTEHRSKPKPNASRTKRSNVDGAGPD